MRRRPWLCSLLAGLSIVSSGVAGAPSASAAVQRPVVGFGDSVAVGYGLSRTAEWPRALGTTSYLDRRFARGGGCRATPRAYPCVFADELGTGRRGRNYAYQAAYAADVLYVQIPQAMNEMSDAARASVRAVTLTVGANDFGFDQCITPEMEGSPGSDPCLAGDIDHLRLSGSWQKKVDELSGRSVPQGGVSLPMVLSALGSAFPRATIYVTSYYAFVPGRVRHGHEPCGMYAMPALGALVQNLPGVSGAAAVTAAGEYVHDLPYWETRFQDRIARVSTFLRGQLDGAVRTGVLAAMAQGAGASAAASTPVAFVSLARTLRRHDVCSRHPWAYNIRFHFDETASAFGITGKLGYSSGKRCPFPMPGSAPDSVEESHGFSASASAAGATVAIDLGFATNCLPHPTAKGQVAIARAVLGAENGTRYCPAPASLSGEGPFGIQARGVSCSFAQRFLDSSRTDLCGLKSPNTRAHCTDRGWRCRVNYPPRPDGGIPVRCRKRHKYVRWSVGY